MSGRGPRRGAALLAPPVTLLPDPGTLAPVEEDGGRGASARPRDGSPSAVQAEEPGDAELIRRVAAGDEGALRQLFRRYAPQAHALALRVSGSAFLAEEAVQEAFVSAWETPPRTTGRGDRSVRG